MELNGKYVVFGRVLEGKDLVDWIETLGHGTGIPKKKVVIADCGTMDVGNTNWKWE